MRDNSYGAMRYNSNSSFQKHYIIFIKILNLYFGKKVKEGFSIKSLKKWDFSQNFTNCITIIMHI